MTFKLLSISALSLLTTLILASCGGNSSSDASQTSSAAASQRPAAGSRQLATVTTVNGISTTTFLGKRANYTVASTSTGYFVTDNVGTEGTSTYTESNRLKFADTAIALDINGTAGQVYRLYQAAFDRKPDLGGVGFQIDAIETSGLTQTQVSQNFINSPEFALKYGSLSDTQFVTQLYSNVLHRAPDDGGLAFHVGNLTSNSMSKAQVLVGFSDSPENKAQVLGAIQHGVEYTPQAYVAGSALAKCPTDITTPLFGTSPVAIADFIAFRPLGFMSIPIHMIPAKHSAFSMTAIGATAVPKSVVAPGKAFVSEIYEVSFSTGGKNYQVFMNPCTEVRLYFGHLNTISSKLQVEFNKGTPSCSSFTEGTTTVTTTCRRENMSIALEEGEQFGTGPDSAGVDFGALDFRRTPAPFIDLTHYDSFYPYYTSPLDYFSYTTRSAIAAKTGDVFGKIIRTGLPVGGTYMQDLAGTAQGNWFTPGKYHKNSTDLSSALGLAHDYADPTKTNMAVGTAVTGMTAGIYSYTVASTGTINRDFADIKSDGSIYCIDSFLSGQSTGSIGLTKPTGILLLSLPTATTLTVELKTGTSCSSAGTLSFTTGAAKFER